MDGKSDWMAYGLAVEGEDGPFAGDELSVVATCAAGDTVGVARAVLEESGSDFLVVVGSGLAVGLVREDDLSSAGDDDPVLDVMQPVPSTVRPSVTLASLDESKGGPVLVTTSEGRLLGQVLTGDDEESGHHFDGLGEEMESELMAVLGAVQEHFGDREPSEDELHAFLRQRLVDEGHSPEEADRFLTEMGGAGSD